MKDYQEYYIQGSDHYLIPKEEFEELLDRIYKAIKYLEKSKLNQLDTYCKYLYINFDTEKIENIDELLQILKGEYNE